VEPQFTSLSDLRRFTLAEGVTAPLMALANVEIVREVISLVGDTRNGDLSHLEGQIARVIELHESRLRNHPVRSDNSARLVAQSAESSEGASEASYRAASSGRKRRIDQCSRLPKRLSGWGGLRGRCVAG
jgi:hypothetical protein